MLLEAGTRLGPYEIVSLRGKGGMGEVYLARDTRLERDVAIKVLPRELSRDDHFRQRFEREAKTLSQLSHPNICTLHDIGAEEGVDYLVLEYLEGETLEERLKRGALPLEQALELAVTIAEAIDAAHSVGIVHRDLKPGNVMLTKDGAKVLDFGLAKGLSERVDSGSTQTPTMTQPLTSEGSILGTLQYMAPEQLEGKEADARSDIWALGAVLYQMVTGVRPFEGESQASLIAAIMTGSALPLRELQPLAPVRLDWLIGRCLEKQPDRRWRSAHDVAIELGSFEQVREGEASEPREASRAGSRGRLVPLAAVLLLGLATGWWLFRGSEERPGEVQDDRWTAMTLESTVWPRFRPALSPDGRTVVLAKEEDGEPKLYRRSVDSFELEPMASGEFFSGSFGAAASFSPDGQQLALVDTQGILRTQRLFGGATSRVLAEDVAPEVFWGHDEMIYCSPRRRPGAATESVGGWRLPAVGGEPEPIGRGNPTALLPGGNILLTFARVGGRGRFWADVVAVDLTTAGEKVLTTGFLPRYLDPGFLVFYREDSIWAAPIDPAAGDLEQAERPIEADVARLENISLDVSPFDVSQSGDLLFLRGRRTGLARLVAVSREGSVEPLAFEPRDFSFPHHSPDGRRLSVMVNGRESSEQWTLDLVTGGLERPERIGVTSAATWVPPEGDEIVFYSTRVGGHGQLFVQPADRSAPAERLWPSEANQSGIAVSPNGRWYVLINFGEPGFFVLDRQKGTVETLLEEGTVFAGDFHPDGDWLVYSRHDTAVPTLWLLPFPGPGEPRQLTFDGGSEPRWSPDGKEIYYRSQTHVMALPVEKRGAELVTGRPEPLFEDHFRVAGTVGLTNYDLLPDGRFLMVEAVESIEPSLALVQNWRAKVIQAFSEGEESPSQ